MLYENGLKMLQQNQANSLILLSNALILSLVSWWPSMYIISGSCGPGTPPVAPGYKGA